MKTNEKYQHLNKQPPIQKGESLLDFAKRVFPDKKNIQYGAPEPKTTPEMTKRLKEYQKGFLDSLDEWFGDNEYIKI